MSEKKKQASIIIPSGIPKIYASGAVGNFSLVDFRILFFTEEALQHDEFLNPTELKSMAEVKLQLVLPPVAAKSIPFWLTKQDELYEHKFGPINQLKPTPPGSPKTDKEQ